jgi:hypothetical protein
VIDQFFRLLSMFIMLFNICNQSDFNRQQCLKDWDVWLIPEIQKGWDLYTEKEKPYQNEKEILEDINN